MALLESGQTSEDGKPIGVCIYMNFYGFYYLNLEKHFFSPNFKKVNIRLDPVK